MRTDEIPGERYVLYDRAIVFIFVIGAAFALASSTALFNDGDVSWHIATGRWILEHGVPSADPFSHSMPGKAWVAHEWLPDIIYATAFHLARYSGLAITVCAALMALFGIVMSRLRNQVSLPSLALTMMLLIIVLTPFMLARPHLLVWPVLAGWTALLLHYRDRGRAPPLFIAAIMILWTNMHGSFPLGLVVAATVSLDALIEKQWDRHLLLSWLTFGIVSGLGALVNVNGMAGITYPFETIRMETLPTIQEWQASSPKSTPWFYVALIGTIGLCLYRGARFRLGEILLLMFLLAMAFSQVRHQSWLAIVAALIVPLHLRGSGELRQAEPLSRIALLAFVVAALLLLASKLAFPVLPTENQFNPRSLLAHIPDEIREQPVFNEYSFGGPLILAGIRPYIDGRADMYGDEFVKDYRAIIQDDPERFDAAVAKYGIRWTILPRDTRLAKALAKRRDWRAVYEDRNGVIHVHLSGIRNGRLGRTFNIPSTNRRANSSRP
jgi:hypothetical protein